MPARLTSFPFQPTMRAASSAFDTCLRNLHPSLNSPLTEEQQFDCFDAVGVLTWDDVPNLDASATLRLAEVVEARLSA